MHDIEYKINFLEKCKLSRNGLLEELKTSCEIVNFCIREVERENLSFEALKQILAIQLRKLLIEEKSILIIIKSDFRMPTLNGKTLELKSVTNKNIPRDETYDKEWISLEEWREQAIMWIDKQEKNVEVLFESTYTEICNALAGKKYSEKRKLFESCYDKEIIGLEGEENIFYFLRKDISKDYITEMMEILDDIGYFRCTLKSMIKKEADQEGAHTDVMQSVVNRLTNCAEEKSSSILFVVGKDLLDAIDKQIPELKK